MIRNWLQSLFAHNKTAIRSVAASVAAAGATAAYTQLVGGHLNVGQVALAAASPVITTIAAYAKSPLTPAQDPPTEGNTNGA